MAWAKHGKGGEYGLFFTDGFLRSDLLHTDKKQVTKADSQVATKLLGYAKAQHRRCLPDGIFVPKTAHVWALRGEGRSLADLVHAECAEETSAGYRAVVCGFSLEGQDSYGGNWDMWIKNSGLHRKAGHTSLGEFRAAALTMLTPLYDEFIRTRKRPDHVFADRGIQYAVAGDA